MDKRPMLLEHLAQTERDIAEGKKLIENQERIIDWLYINERAVGLLLVASPILGNRWVQFLKARQTKGFKVLPIAGLET
jgi:hypothetical protein